MRFLLGLAIGLLLALPAGLIAQPPMTITVEPQQMVIRPPDLILPDPEPSEWGDLTDQEVDCLIRWMEAEVGDGWDAVTVIIFLERAWAEFEGPCDAEVAE